jgi:kynurenine formamidase
MGNMMTNKLIDLSHEVENGMITYKGLPAAIICDFLSREDSRKNYAEGTTFHIGKIEMVANTGTYVDSPFHRFADGTDLSELPLESLANLEGIVVQGEEFGRAIPARAFEGVNLAGKALLIHTGWSRYWRTDQYFDGHPFLTKEAAQSLADSKVAFVGIDTYNIDDTTDRTRPAHTILLGNQIPICEHMCGLENLPESGFHFHAAPVKVKAFGTFPVRAYAVLDK